MGTGRPGDLASTSWLGIAACAFALLDDAEARGFGTPPFSLRGGNRVDAAVSAPVQQGRRPVRIRCAVAVGPHPPLERRRRAGGGLFRTGQHIEDPGAARRRRLRRRGRCGDPGRAGGDRGRRIAVDPTSEILAKKLFRRAAGLKARDAHDLSTAIELAPGEADRAVDAAAARRDQILRRTGELRGLDPGSPLDGIVPYGDRLDHAGGTLDRMADSVARGRSGGG